MSLDTYVKGTKCWFTDVQEGWISATLNTTDVAADGKVTMTFVDDNGKVRLRNTYGSMLQNTEWSAFDPMTIFLLIRTYLFLSYLATIGPCLLVHTRQG